MSTIHPEDSYGEPTAYRLSDFVRATGVALLVGAVVFISIVSFLTLNGVSSSQRNHYQTVKQINANTIQTKRIADGLAKGNAAVSKILVEAGTAVVALESAQMKILGDEYAVCLAVHAQGCQAP